MREALRFLREQQTELQKSLKERIAKKRNKYYDKRQVHIKVTCVCGYEYSTPFNVSDNGKCRKCGKYIFRRG